MKKNKKKNKAAYTISMIVYFVIGLGVIAPELLADVWSNMILSYFPSIDWEYEHLIIKVLILVASVVLMLIVAVKWGWPNEPTFTFRGYGSTKPKETSSKSNDSHDNVRDMFIDTGVMDRFDGNPFL